MVAVCYSVSQNKMKLLVDSIITPIDFMRHIE